MRPALLPTLLVAVQQAFAQAPIPPPVSTDLNSGIPLIWTIETNNNVGWTWSANVGTGGTGGLIMDCGACMGYEETTFWSPWLDLSSSPPIDVTFNCAIIGGSMMLPPPVWIRRDDQSGPEYLYRYGPPDLIPPPDEVIPSSINPFPPLDLNTVQWVSITYPYLGPAQNDSVRIGIGTGVPLGGWALLDDVAIGDITTFAPAMEANDLVVMRTAAAITFRSLRPIERVELMDLGGRVLYDRRTGSSDAVEVPLNGLSAAVYLVRLWRNGAPVVMRIAP